MLFLAAAAQFIRIWFPSGWMPSTDGILSGTLRSRSCGAPWAPESISLVAIKVVKSLRKLVENHRKWHSHGTRLPYRPELTAQACPPQLSGCPPVNRKPAQLRCVSLRRGRSSRARLRVGSEVPFVDHHIALIDQALYCFIGFRRMKLRFQPRTGFGKGFYAAFFDLD